MVEFALVLPVFLLIVVGMVDLGRAFFQYQQLVNGTREGARVGSYDQTTSSIESAVISTTAIDLTATDISITCYSGFTSTAKPCASVEVGDGVNVAVSRMFEPITPLVRNIPGIGPTITINAAAMRSVQ
jgi:Flp pilus assembly protein TadG